MYSVIREIRFSYGHRLLNYEGKCRYLHGHNGRAEIEISSEALDEKGMVADFGEIKKRVQTWIDAEIDHRMILSRADPVVPSLKAAGEPLVLVDGNPTAETIARMIFDRARKEGLPVAKVRFWETDASCVTYSG